MTTAVVSMTVEITKEKTPVIQPSLAPLRIDTGSPVRRRYIQTAMKPAPMLQMINRTPNIESRRIDKAAAAKAMRSTTGFAKDTGDSEIEGSICCAT